MMRLDDCWYSQNLLAWLLLPLSWLFCGLSWLRRKLYQSAILKSIRIPVPVVIVGNISVGGTGKTPLLISLCQLLARHDIKAAIVSRGYGGDYSGVKIVTTDDMPATVGDEPCLLKRRTAVPVAVGADRPAAAHYLLDQHKFDVLLSDDGLQHYRLKRDYEIAVVDASRQLGNGFCLPAGPLRERAGRLNTVDIVAYNDLACMQTDAQNCFRLEFGEAVNLSTGETRPLDSFSTARIHAVAGIGHPERFFLQLQACGINVIKHAYPDHHVYTSSELSFDDELLIMMTEKDAVKCTAFATDKYWYIPVTAILSDQLSSKFITDVSGLLKRHVDA